MGFVQLPACKAPLHHPRNFRRGGGFNALVEIMEDPMKLILHRWLLQGALQGAITSALFFGATTMGAQNPPTETEPRPGATANSQVNKQRIQELRTKVKQDQERLRADLRQYGKNSSQVREARQQLRLDQMEMRKLGGGKGHGRHGRTGRKHHPPPQS